MEYKEIEFKDLLTEETEVVRDVQNGHHDTPLYDKYKEAYRVDDYEVLSHKGWIDIEGVGKTVEYVIWELGLSDGSSLKCADTHIVMRCDELDLHSKKTELTEVYVKDLMIGDFLMTKSGPEMVMYIHESEEKASMYDLQLSRDSDKLYYTNDILSHNSLWMQNIAANAANGGYNVVYFTLEMSEAKVLKRIGSMRLKIPINSYDKKSTDTSYIQEKIKGLYNGESLKGDVGGLFENKVGKINVKFFAAGTANISHLENHLLKLKQKKNFTPDMIIVDYITLMSPTKGLGIEGNLYLKGKHLAEALRALAAKFECPLVTAIQVAKDAWGASEVTLDKVPESKAIAETADTFWAIIRTEDMKRNNKYILKLLKQRDGDFSRSKAKFDLNTDYLTIENDQLIDGE